MLLQTLKNTRQGSLLRNDNGGFCIATIEHPSPGSFIMVYFKHGLSYDLFHKKWSNMKERCYNPNAINFKYYGARGIIVCDEWVNDFLSWYNFVTKLKNAGKSGYTIDRINNDGNYEPGNIRWVSKHEQVCNRRIMKNNTSGYVGVSFDRNMNKWRSTIAINKKRIILGNYKLLEDAVKARDKYIIKNELIEYPLQILMD